MSNVELRMSKDEGGRRATLDFDIRHSVFCGSAVGRPGRSAASRKGLSLIELLVVVAILAVVAGMVVSMTDNLDSRTRYDDTARRLAEIRSAILGPDAVSADGQLLSGGFLQDMGRLPTSDLELLEQGTLPTFTYDKAWKTWYGWHGPYLAAPPRRREPDESRDLSPKDGLEDKVHLYDGWGNDFRGWEVQASRSYSVYSCGGEGAYNRELPDSSMPLIAHAEWESDWTGLLDVEVTNHTSTVFSGVQFKIAIPLASQGGIASDNASVVIPARDASSGVSSFSRFFFEKASLRVPNGRRMLFLVDAGDGRRIAANGSRIAGNDFTTPPICCELKVSRRLSPRAELIIR